jgi:hypothetical protein
MKLMNQEVIAYLIILLAFGIAVYRMLQFIGLMAGKPNKCNGCSSECSLKEYRSAKPILKNYKDLKIQL